MTPLGWFALLLLWILFFWLYRDYRLDYFRQKLFGLRDELFDLADSGRVAFDSPAYGMLRLVINGTIQFGHQFGLLDLIAVVVFTQKHAVAGELGKRFDDKWEAACDELDADTKARLKTIRGRLHMYMAEQLVFTSSVLMFTLVAFVALVLLVCVKRIVVDRVEQLFSNSGVQRVLSTHDYSAAMQAS